MKNTDRKAAADRILYELSTFIINTFHPVWYEPCKRICEFT